MVSLKNKQNIYVAKKVIDLEIEALKRLKNKINSSFNDAVDAIVNCKSKVVLSGVGKSGLIASKISATLSKKDVLILISYSGKTNELKNIIQYANRNKILLIGIISKKDSLLYKASDIKLLTPEVNEAGGIVPTSSTTTQLALGDALAISSMKIKKFSNLDFKKVHP
ncbi:MAG: SIS domain-containing protein, partial [Gammaproteobacteria bacterium]